MSKRNRVIRPWERERKPDGRNKEKSSGHKQHKHRK